MPVKFGKDTKGCFAQWGSQKKYYYECGSDSGKASAVKKAGAQGAAVKRSGYKDGLNYSDRAIKEMLQDGTLEPKDLRTEHQHLIN